MRAKNGVGLSPEEPLPLLVGGGVRTRTAVAVTPLTTLVGAGVAVAPSRFWYERVLVAVTVTVAPLTMVTEPVVGS
jgi:hypothetical protein